MKAKAETDQNSVRATTTTIGKGNQDLRDIPQSVTIVTEKLIEDRRIDTVKEALHHTAGITFQAAEGGEEDIRLRGFSLAASGDIYVDSVRDPAFYERDIFNFDRDRGAARLGVDAVRARLDRRRRQPGEQAAVARQRQRSARPPSARGSYLRVTGDFNLQDSARRRRCASTR